MLGNVPYSCARALSLTLAHMLKPQGRRRGLAAPLHEVHQNPLRDLEKLKFQYFFFFKLPPCFLYGISLRARGIEHSKSVVLSEEFGGGDQFLGHRKLCRGSLCVP